ncbi:hypothetical protein PQX77_016910 [Marasmius sp. AFHP31]|nr:hypothetical protein PQX77_016910 [Marasmius sp. AFHP31]
MAEFPATHWLGLSLSIDLIPRTPLDPGSAANTIQDKKRILVVDEQDTRLITIGDETVPRAIVSNIQASNQYAFYSYRQPKYLATLAKPDPLFNTDLLLEAIRQLPPSFDGNDQSTVAAYKRFFKTFGTHVVTAVQYGSSFQIFTWASNSDSDLKAAWAEDVKADYDGIPSGGQYNPNIKTTDRSGLYVELKQSLTSVVGGDGSLGSALLARPTYKAFEAWATSAGQNPAAIVFFLVELWTLMKESDNEEIVKFVPTAYKAYDWLATHPSG